MLIGETRAGNTSLINEIWAITEELKEEKIIIGETNEFECKMQQMNR